MHKSLHDEAQVRLAGHSEMDVKEVRDPDQNSWRQWVKTVRYIQGSKDLASFMPSGIADGIEAYFDGDWACDNIDRKLHLAGI